MTLPLDRRTFLGATAAAGAAFALADAASAAAVQGANARINVGVMGTGGRGTGLARAFEDLPNVDVTHVCDVDEARVNAAAQAVAKVSGRAAPRAVNDFRRILDDKTVNVLVVATCNHWHAPAAIMACAAGKHVYVEKPCSYSAREGEWLVQAARKHQKKVQMGNQRRSYAGVIAAIDEMHKGVIGRVYLAQAWYQNNRGSIGRGKPADVPKGLDYALWQGPAPARPFHANYLHYNWHWFWHWGNGELGNNGVHTLDLCRWGLGVDFPIHVASSGGRYAFEDDQETPDTHTVTFEFANRSSIAWQCLSCNRNENSFVKFYGEKGSLSLEPNGGYVIHDDNNKEVKKVPGTGGGETEHVANFIAAIRDNQPLRLNQEILEGHKSTLLCHLGNIAHRTGKTLKCNPEDGHILNDADAMKLWRRDYEPGWEPKV